MSGLTPYIKFKYREDVLGLFLVKPILFFIFADIALWAHKRGLPIIVTRTVGPKIEGVSVSNTHAEFRAIDVSIRQWDVNSLDDCISHFNKKYREYAAISSSDLVPRLIADPYHAGKDNGHLHIQIKPDL